jgi:uncharacterized protein with NRDE domain
MCTVVFLRRPDHEWPLILGANRDEMRDRPWRPPGRHWPDRPEVIAGLDELAGGSWLGVNDHGLVAGVLNRRGSLGPAPSMRSRGELVLEALDHADALAAALALREIDGNAYRTFNLFVADNRDAFWLRHAGGNRMLELFPLPEGISMLTAGDLSDRKLPRVRKYLPLFEAAVAPDPTADDWTDWEILLSSRQEEVGAGPESALAIAGESFATCSSALIGLPAIESERRTPVWRFAPGLPRPGEYRPLDGIAGRASIVSRRRA